MIAMMDDGTMARAAGSALGDWGLEVESCAIDTILLPEGMTVM